MGVAGPIGPQGIPVSTVHSPSNSPRPPSHQDQLQFIFYIMHNIVCTFSVKWIVGINKYVFCPFHSFISFLLYQGLVGPPGLKGNRVSFDAVAAELDIKRYYRYYKGFYKNQFVNCEACVQPRIKSALIKSITSSVAYNASTVCSYSDLYYMHVIICTTLAVKMRKSGFVFFLIVLLKQLFCCQFCYFILQVNFTCTEIHAESVNR